MIQTWTRSSPTAAHVVTRTFAMTRTTNVPMEGTGPGGVVGPIRELSSEVWPSTQSPHEIKAFSARVLGISENQVRVEFGDVGGGFGQKMYPTSGGGRGPRGRQGRGAPGEVDRGSPGEPDRGQPGPSRRGHTHDGDSTTRAASWPPRSICSRAWVHSRSVAVTGVGRDVGGVAVHRGPTGSRRRHSPAGRCSPTRVARPRSADRGRSRRSPASRWSTRSRTRSAWTRSSCAAAT